jgi:glycerophosphoryl diester phosphodiesterase
MGADAVELDAKLTSDSVVVCHHDRTLERTTDGRGRVLDWKWEALQALDAGTPFDPRYRGERIPTLQQVFEELGGKLLLNVELTNYGSPRDRLPERVLELVARHSLERRVLLSSFNTVALRRAAKLSPRLPLALLLRPDQGPIRLSLFPWIAPHEARNLSEALVTPDEIDRLTQRGMRIWVWTVNETRRARQLLEWGVHGLITDVPDRMRALLQQMGSPIN